MPKKPKKEKAETAPRKVFESPYADPPWHHAEDDDDDDNGLDESNWNDFGNN